MTTNKPDQTLFRKYVEALLMLTCCATQQLSPHTVLKKVFPL
jgi:hypothetical protein